MNLLLCFAVYTANILGIFTDPFEFEGDYGDEANPIRQKVFEQIVSKEALSKNLTQAQIKQAIAQDLSHGPTFSELFPPELLEEILLTREKFGLAEEDLKKIFLFINRHGDQKVFSFFRHAPQDLLSLDKKLRDKAAREGKPFTLPILSSTEILTGLTSLQLKENLATALFSQETLLLTKPENEVRKGIQKLDKDFLSQFLGKDATNQELEIFCSSTGQAFFYFAYQSLNLHLISQDQNLINQVNTVKKLFAQTLGNPEIRALKLKEKLLANDSGLLFTQESDLYTAEILTQDNLFLPVTQQNPQDGTFIFLRSSQWFPDYQMIAIEGYEGFNQGKLNVALATLKETGEKFLLASSHGNSTQAADGRLQITLIMEKYKELSQKPEYANLQLLIGIDANTKTHEDVTALRAHLDSLGLVATNVGPTTIKQRMVTAQHSKAGKISIDEEDYLITLKTENGGHFLLKDPTVGFQDKRPDINKPLPNRENPSDHYPVGATLIPIHKK